MNGFEKRARRIKETIMQTALEMLHTTELSSIRVADIARKARVSQVTIYNYFGSKEALLREVLIATIDRYVREFEAYMNEGHTLKEKIEFIVLQKKTAFHELPPGTLRELLAGDAELAAYFDKQAREKSLPLTIRLIEEGKRSGEIAEDVSVASILAFTKLLTDHYPSALEMIGQREDMDRFVEDMIRLLFYGICGKPPQGIEETDRNA